MKFSIRLLKEVLPKAEFINLCDDGKEFSFLNIAKLSGSISAHIDESSVLFFPVYAEDVDREGWYDNDFDRRKKLLRIADDNPDWVFVVDSTCPILPENVMQIVVDDIFVAITNIYDYVLETTNPFVVAITGSVGKTTTVAMLEDALSVQSKCLRIYSKRITPLVLWSSVINLLDSSFRYLALEMAFYRTSHVGWMAKTLPPNVSVILNIGTNHLRVDGVGLEQIIESKSKIIGDESVLVINEDELNLKGIIKQNQHKRPVLFSADNEGSDIFGVLDEEKMIIKIESRVFKVKPFLATKMTLYQMMAVFGICSVFGIDLALVSEVLGNFVPKENRLLKIKIKKRECVLYGDITHPSRLVQLADNGYAKSILLVREFDFGIDPFEPKIDGMIEALRKFDLVKISSKALVPYKLRKEIVRANLKNVFFSDDVASNLPADSVIFYHYGGYFRNGIKELL